MVHRPVIDLNLVDEARRLKKDQIIVAVRRASIASSDDESTLDSISRDCDNQSPLNIATASTASMATRRKRTGLWCATWSSKKSVQQTRVAARQSPSDTKRINWWRSSNPDDDQQPTGSKKTKPSSRHASKKGNQGDTTEEKPIQPSSHRVYVPRYAANSFMVSTTPLFEG